MQSEPPRLWVHRLQVVVVLVTLLLTPYIVQAEETETDSALWGGGVFYFETGKTFDFSAEYQIRMDDHMSSLSSQFGEFLGYYKAADNLLLNGGYRFTRRPGRSEHRFYLGGFWRLTGNPLVQGGDSKQLRAVLQIGYQHDFDVMFDDRLMDSDSMRYILVVSKPATATLTPFLLAGVLTTWNDAYDFGIDKIRLGGGVVFRLTENSRLRSQYIWEEFRFRRPVKRTNIIWLRYERKFGA